MYPIQELMASQSTTSCPNSRFSKRALFEGHYSLRCDELKGLRPKLGGHMQCVCEMPEELEWTGCNIKKDWEKSGSFF